MSALQRLGFDTLRKEQIVKAFIAGRDVFAALRTGYGKSLCFALNYMFDSSRTKTGSIVIHASVLMSLMMD